MSTTAGVTWGEWSYGRMAQSSGGFQYFSESMASFRDIRNLLVESFDDDDISEDEFLLLYDANTSKNPDFPYDCYGLFDLNDMDDREC